MKCKVFKGIAAVAICAGFASCSNHDFEFMTQEDIARAKYEAAFIKRFGQPDPSHDWGFSSVYTGTQTRAASTQKWTDDHKCSWKSELTFSRPANAVPLNKGNFTEAEKKATDFYIPAEVEGEFNFNYAFNIPAGAKIYNEGKVTGFTNVNYDGKVTFYNTNEYTHTHATAGRHKFVNTGMLKIVEYGQVGDVYNSGILVLAGEPEYDYSTWPWTITGYKKPVVSNETAIYSTGEDAQVMMPDGISYFNGTIDAHNKVFVEGDWNLQNEDQYRYICALEVTGELYLNKGALKTSYIEAGSIRMNAFPLYLCEDAYVKAGNFDIDPSGSFVYGHTNSKALIEVESFTFKNKNDIVHNFSDNIYFKVSDYIEMNGCFINNDGNYHKYQMPGDLEKLLANTADEYNLVAGRLNEGNYVEGSPACGSDWKFGTPSTEEEKPNQPTTPNGPWRVIAEDLTVGESGDFDFNDVVFDVEHVGNQTKITLLAAGGTLPLFVEGIEVHGKFGVDTNVMVNTNANGGQDGLTAEPIYLSGNIHPQDIEIYVDKTDIGGGNPYRIKLLADEGRVPCKILVTKDYDWCNERQDILTKYPDFKNYVTNKSVKWY